MMAEERYDVLQYGGLVAADDEFVGGDELSMDLDAFWDILEESPKQNTGMDSSLENALQGDPASYSGIYQNSHPESGFQVTERASSLGTEFSQPVTFYPSSNSEAPDSRTGSDISFESAGNSLMVDCGRQEPAAQYASPMHTCSQNHEDLYPQVLVREICSNERTGVSKNEMQSSNRTSSFVVGGANNVSDRRDNSFVDLLKEEADTQFHHVREDTHFKYMLHRPLAGNLDLTLRNSGAFKEDSMETQGSLENNQFTSVDIAFGDADMFSHNATSIGSPICQNSDVISDFGNYSATQFCMDDDATLFADPSFDLFPKSHHPYFLHSNEDMITVRKDEMEELRDGSACSSVNGQGGRAGRYFSEVSSIDSSDVKEHNFKCNNQISPAISNSFATVVHSSVNGKESPLPLSCTRSYMSRENQAICVKDERNDELVGPRNIMQNSVGIIDDAISRKSSYDTDGELLVEQDSEQSLPGVSSCSITRHSGVVHMKDEEKVILGSKSARHFQNVSDRIANRSRTDSGYLRLDAPEQYLPFIRPCASAKKEMGSIWNENDDKLILSNRIGSDNSKVSYESNQSNTSDDRSFVDDDPDICIIEDTSQAASLNQCLVLGNPHFTSHSSTRSDPVHYIGAGGTRKANDEQLIYQAALQDLSQPRSESNLPDGLLQVPLLRHQRIALSWMVQKETASLHCSGGILADDQGLGKTISTIALILKERAPSFRACGENVKQGEMVTLNLDEDDDGVVDLVGVKGNVNLGQPMSNGSLAKRKNALVQTKGRPAAGTLVVCPTSVLRQWAEELRSKVNSTANLSVLVYHGSNRTKDPAELAKYDVVLTTYSIVSMEVPKQPLVDKDIDEKKKSDPNVVSPMGFSTSKKRRHSSISDKGVDSDSLEPVVRPLARVGWFRVVLDEAQSIKNHRTHTARACWGLRAKRRWCLSGTPIQNAIDDLYSYFRFLRYDPYAVYKFFCETIKVPISRSPSKGYKKLQAVLKTIMLRRTKGTLLDGKPIVTLPPKSVELKKVDFSKEERDFYTRLEADSRAQFEEYAAAGTVKQNYVNILLMLLRLRQACDHPLLVKGFDSYSMGRSSIEMAKNLPREKQICLLNYLEASLAICGLCNDPPEDAVVSICGHVFCNQCICEHLTGDDKQCPTTNCKVPLGVSSVFSKATLTSSISDQPDKDSSHFSGSELVEVVHPCFDVQSHNSSKIKAALEVLQSLSRPRDCTSRNSSLMNSFDETTKCPESSFDPRVGESPTDISGRCHMMGDKSSNDSINVVGEKAIVFSQWTKMLDLLENCLRSSSIQYRRLDGTMSVVARDKAVKDFNTLPEVSVMIMSLKAASLGLNMVAACHVLLLDLWWNPTTEDQAIDRAHRIGQTRPVTVLRLTVKDTVEDRILALQQKKREMVASAFGEDESGSRQTRLTVEDLKYLFMV